MKCILIQTTCSSKDEAQEIAKILVESKLAACVQILPMQSVYTWKNKLCCDNEILLNVKTIKANFFKIKSKILKLHSYDVPEIIALDISNISKNYLNFIKDNTI